MSNEPRNLKEALHDTIHRHPDMRPEDIAEELNMAASYLNRAALPDPDMDGPDASGVRFPLKQLVPLIRVTGDFSVLDFIERSLGRVAVDIPRTNKIPCEHLAHQAIVAAADFGGLMQVVQEVLCAGKRIDSSTREDIINEGWVAIQTIAQLIKACERDDQ